MDLINGKQDFNLKLTFETYAPIIVVVSNLMLSPLTQS